MREILFRGKTEQGEWLYGFYHNETSRESPSSDRKITRHHIYTQNFDKFVIPETVGQFTGLTDKNGNKVFEGDIIGRESHSDIRFDWEKYYGKYEIEGIVRYGNFNCSCCNGVFGWYIDDGDIRSFDCHTSLEVIGNIHDNPEILGEEL